VLFDLTFSVDPAFASYPINVQKLYLPQSVTPAISQQTTYMNTVETLAENDGIPQ